MPVNQEDLAGTLMSFPVLIPLGVATLGIELLPEDRIPELAACCRRISDPSPSVSRHHNLMYSVGGMIG
ncbi:hypothetical protein [Streptomyces phytophilus]|uniref:hypothetical protein n=1 Tax=Streptomyces phytophilus TaxID=722715 RepID=UPI001C68859A|nr:hypothetical protein [Streptomyces phytophilus]